MLSFIFIFTPVSKSQLGQNIFTNEKREYEAKHWYSIELNVQATTTFLLLNLEISTANRPVYDFAYIAANPYGEIRRITDVGSKVRDPQLMQGDTTIVQTGIAMPNYIGLVAPNTVGSMPINVWWLTTGSLRE